MTAVRFRWMFRAAAVVYLVLGCSATWRFGLTDYDPAHRFWGVGLGVLAVGVGVFLLRCARFAIALSALGAAVVAIAAAMAAPAMQGPVILAFALLALIAGAYAALAGRVLLGR
jgi:peptidoglycan/LPS O-acetylase OafA/YrhL